eukprot:TRINITY_DN3210_c1_g1_i4.p7 TRINITY_DN3210_c1_g1~~TRINITY_DN3210_c1_g1_i4.p7  ORF type:complete len:104 (-),score=10.19 TRINITY_DN3210_c1_g1_i4:354-665(-)
MWVIFAEGCYSGARNFIRGKKKQNLGEFTVPVRQLLVKIFQELLVTQILQQLLVKQLLFILKIGMVADEFLSIMAIKIRNSMLIILIYVGIVLSTVMFQPDVL